MLPADCPAEVISRMPGFLRRRQFKWILGALLFAMALLGGLFCIDMYRAYGRIKGESRILASPYGDIEYVEGGDGPDVLVIHGSGGGYDQGKIIVRSVLGDDFHWVVPSRFGYLGSTFHEGATFEEQARAYGFLLDHIGIDQAAVVALSHGGPSALLFAAMYPERVSSLTLISCGVASSSTGGQVQADRKGDLLVTIYRHDLLYWSLTRFFRKQFIGLMGASGEVFAGLSPEQRELVDQVIYYMNPSSQRSAGAAFDNSADMPNERIKAIQSPTLVFHALDDMLQLFHNAEYAEANIPLARLVSFDKGGHLLMIVEQERIREEIKRHILESSRSNNS